MPLPSPGNTLVYAAAKTHQILTFLIICRQPSSTPANMEVEGATAPPRETGARDPAGVDLGASQPEDSTTLATPSEIQCAMNYRWRKASLNNPAFSDREFSALSAVDAYLGATRGAFDESLDVLSRGLRVRFKDKYDYQVW